MALATIAAFEQRHGTLSAEDTPKVTGFLDDASDLILEAAPDDVTWSDETDTPSRVRSICIWVAYRAWSNPDALSQTSIGDVALSYTRGGTPDAIFLTNAEMASVTRSAGGSGFVEATLVSPYSGD